MTVPTDAPIPPPPMVPAVPLTPAGNPPPPGGKNGRGPLIAGGVVIFVIALGVGGFFAFKGSDKKTPGPVKTPSAIALSTPAVTAPASVPASVTTSAVPTAAAWSDFGAFSNLIGTQDGTVTTKFAGVLTCSLRTSSNSLGFVRCTNASTGRSVVQIDVALFASADALATAEAGYASRGDKKVEWATNGVVWATS